jgi:hypothetical protein
VWALRDRLTEDLVVQFSQEEGSPKLLNEVTALVARHLPGKISPTVIRDSIVDLIGKPLDRALLRGLAWRMAGNLHRLRKGKAVPPWLGQRASETSPAVILHVERLTRSKGKASASQKETGGLVTFEVQAGTQAGLRLRKWWSTRFAAKHRRVLGFARASRRPENLPPGEPFLGFEDVRQLGGLRLSLRFTQESCKDGLDFDGFTCTGSALDYNRRLLHLRLRVEQPCPSAFSHPCHLCWVGLDRCKASCHPLTFVRQPCSECGRADAFFDPAIRRTTCVDCTGRQPIDTRDLA